MKKLITGLCSLPILLGNMAMAQNRAIIGGGPGTTPTGTGILTGIPPSIATEPALILPNTNGAVLGQGSPGLGSSGAVGGTLNAPDSGIIPPGAGFRGFNTNRGQGSGFNPPTRSPGAVGGLGSGPGVGGLGSVSGVGQVSNSMRGLGTGSSGIGTGLGSGGAVGAGSGAPPNGTLPNPPVPPAAVTRPPLPSPGSGR